MVVVSLGGLDNLVGNDVDACVLHLGAELKVDLGVED